VKSPSPVEASGVRGPDAQSHGDERQQQARAGFSMALLLQPLGQEAEVTDDEAADEAEAARPDRAEERFNACEHHV